MDLCSLAESSHHEIVMLMGVHVVAILVANLFKSRGRLEAENALLRRQLIIALRRAPARQRLTSTDRAILVWMVRLWPNLLKAVQVVKPNTVLRWHRSGFKAFWRWKSRKWAGRPKVDHIWIRSTVRLQNRALTWSEGESRHHRAGRRFCATTPMRSQRSICASFRRWPLIDCSPSWSLAMVDGSCCDLRCPTAEWLARQITEAFLWASAPGYLVRDNDRAYGQVFTARVRAMGSARAVICHAQSSGCAGLVRSGLRPTRRLRPSEARDRARRGGAYYRPCLVIGASPDEFGFNGKVLGGSGTRAALFKFVPAAGSSCWTGREAVGTTSLGAHSNDGQ